MSKGCFSKNFPSVRGLPASPGVAFGAFEWASSTVNVLSGCGNACRYCYARANAARFKTRSPARWHLEQVRTSAIKRSYSKRSGTVMFPSAHDLRPEHLEQSIKVLQKLLAAGNRVLVVTKPFKSVVGRICKELHDYRSQILFRFTIGSPSARTLHFWEPNAPSLSERLESLRLAFRSGYATSVSCEPMLDARIEDLIERVLPYVTDAIWIGKPNYLFQRLRANQEDDALTLAVARQLITDLSDDFIKRLYAKYSHNKRIKWKDSIKKVVGIPSTTRKGQDS